MSRVNCYETGDVLDGEATEDLVWASEASEPTGAVSAWRRDDGRWYWVPDVSVEMFRRMGRDVRTVWVG